MTVFKYALMSLWARLGRRIIQDHYVFVLEDVDTLTKQCAASASENLALNVYACAQMSDIPRHLLNDFIADRKAEAAVASRFDEGGHAYLLTVNDKLASFAWIKSGANLDSWFIDLNQRDLVMYAVYTKRAYRGRRLWSHLTAAAYRAEYTPGCKFYCDCNVANIPSRRHLERSGFKLILRAPHLAT